MASHSYRTCDFCPKETRVPDQGGLSASIEYGQISFDICEECAKKVTVAQVYEKWRASGLKKLVYRPG